MVELTAEQRQMLRQANGGHARLVDPETRQEYVVIRAETYERLRSLLAEEGDNQFVHDSYPYIMEVFGREGWDDTSMDVYNDLDPRKPS
jgi:hypothetical protein